MNNEDKKGYYASLSGFGKAVPIILGCLALFLGICLIIGESGALGMAVSGVLRGMFSIGAYFIPILLAVHAVCYAADVALGKRTSRIAFSCIIVLSVSAIEYAICLWGKELAFAPIDFYVSASAGGFIGSTIGFLTSILLGNIGTIILFLAILAVYGTFFYTDKNGSFHQRIDSFKSAISSVSSGVQQKIKETNDKNKKIKEEEAFDRRRQASDELADDDFFSARSGDEVTVTSLTSNESEPVSEPEVIEEVNEPIPEKKVRTKPLDLNYGIEDTDITYRTSFSESSEPEVSESAPETVLDKKFFGLDDSAENVFTQSFEPFNFATSEKLASKPSSKAIVQEELDDITMLEMRGDRELTDREKRRMEFERKKQLWMQKKDKEEDKQEVNAPQQSPAPVADESAPTVQAEPVQETAVPTAPAATTYTTPVTPVPAYTPPVTPAPTYPPVNSTPTYTPPVEPSVKESQTPSYASHSYVGGHEEYTFPAETQKSAEKVDVYSSYSTTKTTYQSTSPALEFTLTNNPVSEQPARFEYTFDEPAAAPAKNDPSPEEVAALIAQRIERSNPAYARSANPMTTYTTVIPDVDKAAEPEIPEPIVKEVPVAPAQTGAAAPAAVVTPDEPIAYEAAEPTVTTEDTIDIKPYSAPEIPTSEAIPEETSLKVEREMLAPSVSAVAEADEVAEEIASAEEITEDAAPVYEDSAASDEGDFEWTEESDEDEAVDELEAEDEEEISDEEIPPEEQNPDVLKMREMFPFLDEIGNSESKAVEQEEEEEYIPEVEDTLDDEPPFDIPEYEEPEAKQLSLAVVPKEEKKKNDYSNYVFPSIELLGKNDPTASENTAEEIQETKDNLIETLASFNVIASVKGVDRGPRITRYEVVPAKGVKVSSILKLQNDIELNLAAGAIRMEAPIPGKSAVGIEIPNKRPTTVRLRNLIESEEFQSNNSKTAVCIGRDVAGVPIFGDIAKMPHLLIAGATGMGKSVCINSLLVSILYKARPDEVKLIMIDPKLVEFTMYDGIPHLLVPVVTDAKQSAGALMWAVEEMERRYNLLKNLCVRDIDGYNKKVEQDRSLGEPMPSIIIVIDEFADLMLQVKDPVEKLVSRIAAKARAAGIYLIIGTQRPSVDVITGVIKSNIPSRIACKVMSNVDSRTILDTVGAESLLDRGDMLYAPKGAPKPNRVQGAFVEDSEVEAIMNHIKSFSNGDSYDNDVLAEINRAAQKCSKRGNDDDDDEGVSDSGGEGYLNNKQFLDAVEIAVNTRKISTSLIQRKLSIGYGKAAKFIDVMEDMGIVGEANGQRPREVLITPDEWSETLARRTLD